ncbi:hypothetical protein BC628DRAFT_1084007 [Trametes gibbosa]|nr:hypothetical protein BC628DRAFT_1084007 [Trametes gibbosa]
MGPSAMDPPRGRHLNTLRFLLRGAARGTVTRSMVRLGSRLEASECPVQRTVKRTNEVHGGRRKDGCYVGDAMSGIDRLRVYANFEGQLSRRLPMAPIPLRSRPLSSLLSLSNRHLLPFLLSTSTSFPRPQKHSVGWRPLFSDGPVPKFSPDS